MKKTTKGLASIERKGRFGGFQLFLFVLIAVVIMAGVTFFVLRVYVFPSEFKPVTLNAKGERILEQKLGRLDVLSVGRSNDQSKQTNRIYKGSEFDPKGNLIPERYSEEGASREIAFSERELNALLAKNTDMASKLAIDLSDNSISAKLLLPINEDFPILGGQVLKVRAGIKLAYDQGKPTVVLRGVSVMGVPLPSAWLGGMKNIDLTREYGAEAGFWSSFAAGVEHIHVEEGILKIKLKE